MKKKLAPIPLTADQWKWVEKEKERTGNTTAAVIRGLIQSQAEKESKHD